MLCLINACMGQPAADLLCLSFLRDIARGKTHSSLQLAAEAAAIVAERQGQPATGLARCCTLGPAAEATLLIGVHRAIMARYIGL